MNAMTTRPLSGLRAALQWRMLLLWTSALLLPALLVAVPGWLFLQAQTAHVMDAGAIASGADVPRLLAVASAAEDVMPALSGSVILSALVALLLSPFLAGMVAASIRSGRVLGFGELIRGGLAEYGPMLRMLLWSVLPLGIAIGIGAGLIGALSSDADSAVLASSTESRARIGMLVLAVLFVLAHATVESGRAILGVNGQSRSAVRAWWRGVKLLLRRPLPVLGICLLTLLLGLAVAAAFLLLRQHVDRSGIGGALVAFVLAQLAVATLCWSRIARLYGLAAVARR